MINNMVTHKAEKNCKVPVLLVLGLLFGISNLFAQTAMVTNNFVYYPDSADKNYQCRTLPKDINMLYDRSFYTTATAYNTNVQSVDPWVNSALIEFDKVFPDEKTSNPPYPNHCLTLCAEVTCSNPVRKVESSDGNDTSGATHVYTMASGDFPIQTILFDIFKYQANINPYSPDSAPPIRTIAMYPSPNSDINNICKGVPVYDCKDSSGNDDPTKCKSCCDNCTWPTQESYCSPKSGSCTLSSCNTTYCNLKNRECFNDHNDDWCTDEGGSTYANCNQRYPGVCELVGGVCKYIGPNSCTTNYISTGVCNSDVCHRKGSCRNYSTNKCEEEANGQAQCEGLYGDICEWVNGTCQYKSSTICHDHYLATEECDTDVCQSLSQSCTQKDPSPCDGALQSACTTSPASYYCQWHNFGSVSCDDCDESVMAHFKNKDQCNAGITTLNFCTAWDGSYEIDGEFGKTNGQFGYRTTIKTNYPGDGISVASDLSIEHMIVYPGDTQIPIQVDVTNVHSVRSSPTLVGKSPAVITQPYRIRYRLSKDATTVINIMDPTLSGSDSILRHLVKGQPRDGEGFQGGVTSGSSPDIQITNEDAWDGRDDEGRLLPYGNYLVSIQATSQDEWSGTAKADISRAVTRQLSLDPLKITDIVVTGLGKQSTSYAMLSYMLTEAATVHFEVYTPGTTFKDLNISSNISYGNGYYTNAGGLPGKPEIAQFNSTYTGKRVAKYSEQKEGRKSVNSKWDGMCWDEGGDDAVPSACGKTSNSSTTSTGYAYGGAMPDGDYVYLLWAEIPYKDSSYGTGASYSTVSVNGVKWDGVKTYMIYNGILPVNRGYPEITIDAVSYSTIGSSPIANGLDPFVVSYSLSRDSYVDAGIYTTAASGTVTAGICESSGTGGTPVCAPYLVKTISNNEVKEALTKNVYYWDGLDDLGRYVSAGNYMLRITAKDALFPAKMVTRTIEFPVDMFRVVDVETTPLLETSSGALNGLASISYMLSKSMGSEVKIYDRGVVIPKGGYDGNGNACPWPPLEYGNAPYCTAATVQCCIHDTDSPTSTVNPIKVFRGTEQGEGYTITDFWDGYETYDTTGTDKAIMVKDGLYPYVIIASAPVAGSQYYDTSSGVPVPLNGKWHELDYMLASDKVTGYITVSRGPVYFTNIKINPTKPTQYYSSATVELAPYEIQFAVNRGSSVTVEVISMEDYTCNNEPAPSVCRTLTQTNYTNGNLDTYMVYDANVINTLYWDGKDNHGKYVKTANYQIKFSGQPYLTGQNANSIDINDGNGSTIGIIKTVESRSLSVNNFQVFDRYIWDVSKQNSEQGKFAFQVSVPMKTAIQIYKPGTVIAPEKGYLGLSSGTLVNPIYSTYTPLPAEAIVYSTDTSAVLVKAIVGVRPNLVSLEEIWDGTDYAGQKVPDGIYPYRYVTVLDSYRMNSVTGDPILEEGNEEYDEVPEVVADWDKFINLGLINVANGDSWYADLDWKNDRVTSFYPNPVVNKAREGFFEITKVPAPGTVSIKIYNIAGDLVKDSGYDCVNALGTTASLENINASGGISPDWNGYGTHYSVSEVGKDPDLLNSKSAGRNFALRCRWKTDNNAGKSVARGLYYAIMTLEPNRGNAKKSQKVVKILIP